ncbi:MAG: hypothetical protein H5U06_04140 [Candidatus Aminicenantes bacterium]|nr:hypothetical protein [Candidatus Aminicenantes bacterium]
MTKIYTPTYHELGKSATILARKALIRARLFFSPLYKIIHAQRKIAESPEKSLSLSSLAKSSDCSPSWLSATLKDFLEFHCRAI